MRRLALLVTTIILALSSVACMRGVSLEKETESTANLVMNETENNTIGSPLVEESTGVNISESANKQQYTINTSDGTLVVDISNIEKYIVEDSLNRIDICLKENEDIYSTVYIVDNNGYEAHIENQMVNGSIEEIERGSMAITHGISQTEDVDTQESTTEVLWDTVFYKYTDATNTTYYIHSLTNANSNMAIFVENENSKDIAKNIFLDLWFEKQ